MEQPRRLPESAHRPLKEGEAYQPYVPASIVQNEFTVKALFFGVLFGVLFGAANAYLGLRAGLTISTSIPVAVMTVAAFHALRKMGGTANILEANMAQTVGSSSSSVASGVIFTLPALFLWGLYPSLLQMTLLALAGGLLGVLFMVPLRRLLIVKGPRWVQERKEARHLGLLRSLELRRLRSYPMPGTASESVILVLKKSAGRAA